MQFADYQREARKTAQYPIIGHGIVYPALGLAGEAGEVLEKIKKVFRDHNGDFTHHKESIIKEAGDVLWYLSALCDELGTNLDYVAHVNIEKLESRKDRGVIGGKGDDR
ncbi:MAG: nucleoside triphosphate pyrophosphohydrolase family protein [Desulfobulbaceae bacterium]|nr:nucleoside triphosphate pyrophosphohydrolase family protein [Desulfobulbaceae bacterium]